MGEVVVNGINITYNPDYIWIADLKVWWPSRLYPRYQVDQVVMIKGHPDLEGNYPTYPGVIKGVRLNMLPGCMDKDKKIDPNMCSVYYEVYVTEVGQIVNIGEDLLFPATEIGQLLYGR